MNGESLGARLVELVDTRDLKTPLFTKTGFLVTNFGRDFREIAKRVKRSGFERLIRVPYRSLERYP